MDQSRREAFAHIKRGTVAIVTQKDGAPPPSAGTPLSASVNLLGSGFLVTADGWVATNQHVVRPYALATIRHLQQGAPRPPSLHVAFNSTAREEDPSLTDNQFLRVLQTVHDDAYDLALLRVFVPTNPRVALSPLSLAQYRCSTGDIVDACGFPLGLDLQSDQLNGTAMNASFCAGMVADGIDPLGGDSRFSLDMIINPGNSGGPIFDVATGLVVGIVELRAQRPVDDVFSAMGLDLPPHLKDRKGIPVGRGRGIHVDCLHELQQVCRMPRAEPTPDEPFKMVEGFSRRHPSAISTLRVL